MLQHSQFVRALARSLLQDEALADDVAQQTWLAALRHPPRKKAALRAWLGTVARNFALRLMRSERRRAALERAAAPREAIPSADEILGREKEKLRLVEAVQALSGPLREAVVFRFYEDLPPREIAKHLGVPVETVKTRLARGLDQLRRRLDEQHGGDRRQWCLALAPVAGLKVGVESAGAAVTSSLIPGALLMSAKMKIGFAVALVVVAAFSLWTLLPEGSNDGFDSSGESPLTAELSNRVPDQEGVMEESSAEDPTRGISTIASSMLHARITGSVLNRLNNEAVAGALVQVNPLPHHPGDGGQSGETDSSGVFSVSLPLERDREVLGLHLRIGAPGFKNLESAFTLAGMEGDLACGSFYLRADKIYTVRIKDADGKPVPRARLEIVPYLSDFACIDKIADAMGMIRITDQEVERKVWRNRDSRLQITAPGLADHFHEMKPDDDPPFPEEIVMEPEGFWTGRVLDASSRLGLAGAEVLVSPRGFSPLMTPWGLRSCLADASGSFRLPRFSHLRKTADGYTPYVGWVMARAEGYLPARIMVEKGRFPEHVLMKKAALMKRGIAVDASTGYAIPNLEMRVDLNFERLNIFTDEGGSFRFPLMEGRRNDLWIDAPGYSYFRVKLYPDSLGDDPYVVSLAPVVQRELRMIVRDDLDRPVPGAYIRFSYLHDPVGGHRTNAGGTTNPAGELLLRLFAQAETDAQAIVSRTGFCTLGPVSVPIGPECPKSRTFALKRGCLFQNIRVKDGKHQPVAGVSVTARLNLEGGAQALAEGLSDEGGYCNLSLPPFKEGRVFVWDREDTAKNVTYRELLEGKEITLILTEEPGTHGTIQGVVKDQSGNPLSGIWIYHARTDDPEGSKELIKTDGKGSFTIPAFQDKLYRLFFEEGMNYTDGSYYRGDDLEGLATGAELEIVMTRFACLYFNLKALRDKYDKSLDYDVYLEDEEGLRLNAGEVVRRHRKIFFLDPPSGRMRIVVTEASTGLRMRTTLFELRDGRPVDDGAQVGWEAH